MRRALSRPRGGFTILEVGIIITLSAVLISLGVMLFSVLLQAQRQTMLRDRSRREIFRVDALLRRDAHAATAVEAGDADTCVLRDERGNAWTYRTEATGLVREYRRDDQVQQHEFFQLLPGTKVTWEVQASGSRSLLKMKITPPEVAARMPVRLPTYEAQILVGGLQPAKGAQP